MRCNSYAFSIWPTILLFLAYFTLKPQQRDILNYMWNNPTVNLLISLPTGYGKSIFYHLGGLLLHRKNCLSRGGTVTVESRFVCDCEPTSTKEIPLVIVPLNLIQKDQLLSLKARKINACKLDIFGTAMTSATAAPTSTTTSQRN
ncbi:hypothetical protein SNE40_012040 [Patella caerulea]|uniref:Uncharacterized protein n=1 Tax=Patella caerulea TaxID=87958 RepID=A0AAN8JMQ7_PATCE